MASLHVGNDDDDDNDDDESEKVEVSPDMNVFWSREAAEKVLA